MITVCCNSGNSTGSGQAQAGRVAKKHGRIITSSPPIVAKRARTAAKLWVFGWPRFSQRNWRTSNPTSVCRQVAQDLSKPPALQLQLELELAARRLLLVLGYCNTSIGRVD
jgi:hypothetical protein